MPNYCAHRACRTTAPCRHAGAEPTLTVALTASELDVVIDALRERAVGRGDDAIAEHAIAVHDALVAADYAAGAWR